MPVEYIRGEAAFYPVTNLWGVLKYSLFSRYRTGDHGEDGQLMGPAATAEMGQLMAFVGCPTRWAVSLSFAAFFKDRLYEEKFARGRRGSTSLCGVG